MPIGKPLPARDSGGGHLPPGITEQQVRDCLQQILTSPQFSHSERMNRFLRFVVEAALAGTQEQLKEYLVGVEVFDRPSGYDPHQDPIVRVEARRLRAKLEEYYANETGHVALIISMPKGSYVPVFHLRERVPAHSFPTQRGEQRRQSFERRETSAPAPSSNAAGECDQPGNAESPLASPSDSLVSSKGQGGHKIRNHRFPGKLTVGIGVGLGLALSWWMWFSRIENQLPSETMTMTRLTDRGNVKDACISPDGRYVVYVVVEEQLQSLWLQEISSGSRLRLVPPAEVRYFKPTFSHDGHSVFYVQRTAVNHWGDLYRISPLVGASEKLLERLNSPVALSPDDRQIAFVRETPAEGRSELLLAAADGSSERTLLTRTLPEAVSIEGVDWSLDGKEVIYGSQSFVAGRGGIQIRRVQDSTGWEEPGYPHKWVSIRWFSRLPNGAGIALAANNSPSARSHQIWLVSGNDGAQRQLTHGLSDYRGISVTRDSRRLVTVKVEHSSNLWVASAADLQHWKQISFGVASFIGSKGVCWTPSGDIVFTSDAGGLMKLWITDREGKTLKRITSPPGDDMSPSVSRDGRYLVYDSSRAGTRNIWRMDLRDNALKRMTFGDLEEDARVSPDGQQVVYCSLKEKKKTLWRMPIDGGEGIRLSPQKSEFEAVSPDGRFVACNSWAEANQAAFRIAILPIAGGAPWKTFAVPVVAERLVQWHPDGRSLDYISRLDGKTCLMSLPIDGSPAKRLADFGNDTIFAFAWSADGRFLVVSRGTINRDAVMLSDFM